MSTLITFANILITANFTWFNEPKLWNLTGNTLHVHTDADTDFWRKTHYGFERDTGHFFYQRLAGDQPFEAKVMIRGNYHTLYDQGGLMIRIDERNWIKCGIEYVDGQQFASAVVTVNGWSDWNVIPIQTREYLKLKVTRDHDSVHIDYAGPTERDYRMMRLAYFPIIDRSQPMLVGIMCASPNIDTQGFDMTFEEFQINGTLYKNGTNCLTISHLIFYMMILMKLFFE